MSLIPFIFDEFELMDCVYHSFVRIALSSNNHQQSGAIFRFLQPIFESGLNLIGWKVFDSVETLVGTDGNRMTVGTELMLKIAPTSVEKAIPREYF